VMLTCRSLGGNLLAPILGARAGGGMNRFYTGAELLGSKLREDFGPSVAASRP
jgi:hypothetical protein